DAIFSAARYLAAAGGTTDISRAIFSYNHADWYVSEVLGLAKLYGAGTTVAFTLDSLQRQLDGARQTLARFGDRLVAARADAAKAERVTARWRARAEAATLLSDRLTLEQRAGDAAARAAAANQKVAALEQSVEDARSALARVQEQSAPVSFASGSEPLLGGPTAIDGYVFPVGGGAGSVSASHSHHDYPAVDIAAPLGAPLYALTGGIVVRAWSTIDPRCGIGFTMRADDGREWTYCHMSVLDSTVAVGARLTAGQPVGLVGATGDATGPHLHLQLQPASTWPQRESWFQAFAGTAFHWQDGAPADWTTVDATATLRDLQFSPGTPPAETAAGPVFAVVPDAQSGGVVYFSSGS
ncbi:MAG: peptidoglycan DD-metalloendopeptidase family protein, partial [Actinomycetota bacterium]